METLRLDIVYRPLRVGWALRADDFASFRKAVRLSYALWGGRFNPILIVDREADARQQAELYRLDMIWPISEDETTKQFAKQFKHLANPFFGERLISEDGRAEILDVHNALAYVHDKPEWKVAREGGFTLFGWQPGDKLADVLLMQAGGYPEPAAPKADYRALLQRAADAVEEKIAAEATLPVSLVERRSIPYLSRFGLKASRDGYTSQHPGFYIGDASSFDDLVACWNLRAADIPLWFMDRGAIGRYGELIPQWIKRVTKSLAIQQHAWVKQVAVWSRGDAEADAKLLGDQPRYLVPVSDLTWNGLNLRVPVMSLGETSVLGVVGEIKGSPKVSFGYGTKPFSSDAWFYQQRLVASVSSIGGLTYNAKHLICPPYVPELNEDYARHMVWDHERLRSEPNGIGLVLRVTDHDSFIIALPFDALMAHVFRLAGYEAKLSSGGLIAQQLIDQLDGVQGARVFKIAGVRRLIDTYGLNDTFSRNAAIQLIGGSDPENPGAKFADHHDLHIEQRPPGTQLTPADAFGYLVEHGLFRLGADVKCPRCQMTTWVPLDTLKERVTCDRCGHEHHAARQLAASDWRFRRSGVLGAERNAQGAIPVALTLQQLDTTVHGPFGTEAYSASLDLTPLPGKLGKPCEIDLVWLMAKARWDENRTVIILGECKNKKVIDANTVKSLAEVADAFPKDRFEVYILLSKIAPFTPDEIERAKALNTGGRRRVIMLTARELEPYFIYERTKKEFSFTDHGHDPQDMANITAEIYFSPASPKKTS